jgi:hypothetical protein
MSERSGWTGRASLAQSKPEFVLETARPVGARFDSEQESFIRAPSKPS